jgi:hypothetical protein
MADGEKWLRRDAVDDVIGLLLQLLADFGRCRRDRYDDSGWLQLSQLRRSSASLLVFDAELLKLCPHRGEPLLERGDDVSADLVRSEGDLVYEPTPAVDLIFSADDRFISVAIHGEEALGLLDLPRQIIDVRGLDLHSTENA